MATKERRKFTPEFKRENDPPTRKAATMMTDDVGIRTPRTASQHAACITIELTHRNLWFHHASGLLAVAAKLYPLQIRGRQK